jgi:hypothetical protein
MNGATDSKTALRRGFAAVLGLSALAVKAMSFP